MNAAPRTVTPNLYNFFGGVASDVRRLAHGNLVPPGDLFYQHADLDVRQE
jgi:hypothetical protein